MRAIAVRGFINEKFNTTFGKNLYRRAIYNGSVELKDPNQKYLVDFYSYLEFEVQAKNDHQIANLKELEKIQANTQENFLFSWILHYEPLTKTKTRVDGYAVYSVDSSEMYIKINDLDNQTQEDWSLDVHSCKTTGMNKPVFIATNFELEKSSVA